MTLFVTPKNFFLLASMIFSCLPFSFYGQCELSKKDIIRNEKLYSNIIDKYRKTTLEEIEPIFNERNKIFQKYNCQKEIIKNKMLQLSFYYYLTEDSILFNKFREFKTLIDNSDLDSHTKNNFIGQLEQLKGSYFIELEQIEVAKYHFLNTIHYLKNSTPLDTQLLIFAYQDLLSIENQKGIYDDPNNYVKELRKYSQNKENVLDIHSVADERRKATNYLKKKKFTNSLEALNKSIKQLYFLREKDLIEEATFISHYNVSNLKLAEAYLKMGDAEKSKNLILSFFENNKDPNAPFHINFLDLYGDLNMVKNDFQNALKHYKQALYIKKSNHPNSKNGSIGDAHLKIGNLYKEIQLRDSALNHYQLAMINYSVNFDATNIQKNPSIKNLQSQRKLLTALIKKADCFLIKNQQPPTADEINIALKTSKLAIQLLGDLRLNVGSDFNKHRIIEESYIVFELSLKLIDLQNAPNKKNLAFDLFQKCKSMILFDEIQRKAARKFIPIEIREKEMELRDRIATAENAINNLKQQGSSLATLDGYNSEKEKLINEHKKLTASYGSEYEEFFKSQYDSNYYANIEYIRNQLASDQAYLEYFVATDNIYTFFISKENAEYKSIRKPEGFREQTSQFQTVIAEKQFDNEAKEIYAREGYYFYKLLIESILDHTEYERLIIVPDKELWNLPFAAFLTESTPQNFNSYKELTYLGKQTAISTQFSATLWKNLKNSKRENFGYSFVAFAHDFKEVNQAPMAFAIERGSASGVLKHLKYCLSEVKSVITTLDLPKEKFQSFINEFSNFDDFIRYSDSANVLLISSHALSHNSHPDSTYIALNPTDRLYLSQLYKQDFIADLIVLSACQTNSGLLDISEGNMSLSRAFIYAGAKSMLTTQWSVNDEKTAQLIPIFFKELTKGLSKDIALKNAVLEYLGKNPDQKFHHPYYWAAFTQLGNFEKIDVLDKSVDWLSWVLGLLGFFFIIFLWRRRKNEDQAIKN